MEGGIFWKKLVHNCNKRGVEGGKKIEINKRVSTFIREMRTFIREMRVRKCEDNSTMHVYLILLLY